MIDDAYKNIGRGGLGGLGVLLGGTQACLGVMVGCFSTNGRVYHNTFSLHRDFETE